MHSWTISIFQVLWRKDNTCNIRSIFIATYSSALLFQHYYCSLHSNSTNFSTFIFCNIIHNIILCREFFLLVWDVSTLAMCFGWRPWLPLLLVAGLSFHCHQELQEFDKISLYLKPTSEVNNNNYYRFIKESHTPMSEKQINTWPSFTGRWTTSL